MRNSTIRSILKTGLLSALLLSLGACKGKEDKVEAAQEKVQEAREDLRDERKDVVEEKKDVVEEQRDVAQVGGELERAKAELAAARDEFMRVSREKLARMDAQIQQLETKADAKSKKVAADLRVRRNQLAAKIDRASDRTAENWNEFKADVDKNFEEIQNELDKAF